MKYLFIPIPIGESKESKPEGYIESLDLAVKEIEKTGFSEVINKDRMAIYAVIKENLTTEEGGKE